MKAIIYTRYGSTDVLKLEEIPKPTPGDNEVLVKVYAASANAADWHMMRGKPFLIRLMVGGLLKPKNKILGADIAGRVETVGRNVKQFQPGDEVFGDISECGWGAFAEYVCASEDAVILKPDNLTFEEAAAVPIAAISALQGLRDKRQIKPGDKVLINGASGGVGTFAIQIAKSFGAEVTGVCSTKKLQLVRSIGADQVIDYTQEDFTQNGQLYDLIFDAAAYRSISDYKRSLSPKGMYLLVGGSMTRIIQVVLNKSKKIDNLVVKSNKKDLVFMKGLLESGQVAPVVDRIYPLNRVAEALRYLEERHVQGKVVIKVEQ
ncbi:MAG: NAD(P)-dependent alcohol dehydrogenase [Halanaerobiales bacterium]|nr:NAD(P)-dependent alcohol dehydrogenase [Halanaerobiales bacterium]